jgi:hypothetical protein
VRRFERGGVLGRIFSGYQSHPAGKHSRFEGIGRTLDRMVVWLILILRLAAASLKSRQSVLLENLALRHQLLVLNRGSKRPRLTPLDRALWAWLSQTWRAWRTSLRMVQPDTVVRWHRAGFRLFWRWKSRPRRVGRQAIASDTINLIREMSGANPLRGAPRIHAELLKLGITLAQRTVAKYMVRRSPCSPEPTMENFPAESPRTNGLGGFP